MNPNPSNPWCVECRYPAWTGKPSSKGARGFQCPKCGRCFYEHAGHRGKFEKRVQEARELLDQRLSQNVIVSVLHCRKTTVQVARARYGRPEPVRTRARRTPSPRFWPFDQEHPLVQIVNSTLRRDLPEYLRREVAQEMLLEILTTLGDTDRFVRRQVGGRPFGVLSLDEEWVGRRVRNIAG